MFLLSATRLGHKVQVGPCRSWQRATSSPPRLQGAKVWHVWSCHKGSACSTGGGWQARAEGRLCDQMPCPASKVDATMLSGTCVLSGPQPYSQKPTATRPELG